MTKVEMTEYNEHHDRDAIAVTLSNTHRCDNDNNNNSNNNVCFCIRKNSRVVFWTAVLLLSVAVILPLEILDIVYRNKSFWINLYGSEDVGEAAWCEAIDADVTDFIIEPWNSRSDYVFMAWGCFLLVLGFSDLRVIFLQQKQKQATSSTTNQQQQDHPGPTRTRIESAVPPFHDEEERHDNGKHVPGAVHAAMALEEGPSNSSISVRSPFRELKQVPNPLFRYPHITMVNGIFNILHGLGSFWNHACECGAGGRADVSGMLSVTVFPLFYTPVQLLLISDGKQSNASSCTKPCFDGLVSMIPPIGQTLFFVLVWFDVAPSTLTFTIVMACTVGILPLVFAYLYCWRNKGKIMKATAGRPQQQHRLRLWLYPLGLACFGFGYWAWELDVDKVWCFQEGVLKVLQGHAVWHLLTAVALICVYWLYRSEELTLVSTSTDVVDDDSASGAGVEIIEMPVFAQHPVHADIVDT
jgi:hypothetical protein